MWRRVVWWKFRDVSELPATCVVVVGVAGGRTACCHIPEDCRALLLLLTDWMQLAGTPGTSRWWGTCRLSLVTIFVSSVFTDWVQLSRQRWGPAVTDPYTRWRWALSSCPSDFPSIDLDNYSYCVFSDTRWPLVVSSVGVTDLRKRAVIKAGSKILYWFFKCSYFKTSLVLCSISVH